ncbi:hypothetical protein EMM73_06780 [Rheinheimera sediminis]|uniref:hypothetical protein n=1 Tax=Rheinheimera sp. YQF-1 TaxID=2499626 RepID=UPI000FD6E612|nr:hypothetical protein [Rheinheimera sp. YQF-1]RVT46884.1 hypothetical protein EMM73_06780 [Rheinheimera sp. YQF-1]
MRNQQLVIENNRNNGRQQQSFEGKDIAIMGEKTKVLVNTDQFAAAVIARLGANAEVYGRDL